MQTDDVLDVSKYEMSPAKQSFYKLSRFIFRSWAKLWLRFEVRGTENVSEEGGFIYAPGAHRSYLDTPLAASSSPRVLRFMGAERFFEIFGLGHFLRGVGGFPVERSLTDRDALRHAQHILESGEPLVIFPEGARLAGPKIDIVKEGAAFLACRANVPVLPVGIGGAERAMGKGSLFIKPRKVVIIIGEPVVPPIRQAGERVKRSQIRAFSQELNKSLQDVYDQAQIAAGV